MRAAHHLAGPVAALSLLAGAAQAQDRPVFQPTRDVSVTYTMSGAAMPPGAAGRDMRMSWLTAEGKLRVDLPGGMGWSLVEQRAQRMAVVMDAQRMVMEMPTGAGQPGGMGLPTEPPAGTRFTRLGSATVAGTACTMWRYVHEQMTGESCVTADGVMLRTMTTVDGRNVSVEATQVAYGAQDPARFRVPEGYQRMQMPVGGGMPGGPPGGRPPGR